VFFQDKRKSKERERETLRLIRWDKKKQDLFYVIFITTFNFISKVRVALK
jgi:hypothetical protein